MFVFDDISKFDHCVQKSPGIFKITCFEWFLVIHTKRYEKTLAAWFEYMWFEYQEYPEVP